MNLTIKIIDKKPEKINNVFIVYGQLIINDYEENFHIPLDLWSITDYKKQWREGLGRIKTCNQSCLVVAIHNPAIRPYINWWILYKVDSKIYIQNQMLVGEIYEKKIGDKEFNRETCYDFISPRRTKAYGRKISEWSVDYP